MGRSLGFGSTRGDCGALFRLAFAAAPSFTDLTSPPTSNSPAHSSKGTPSGYLVPEGSRQHPLTACRHSVSGTVSLPSRGAFHLSLTVLVHYRWQRVFSLRRWSSGIPPGFLVSRGTRELGAKSVNCGLPGCDRLWPCFPAGSTNPRIGNFVGALPHASPLPRPPDRKAGRLDTIQV